VASGTVTFKLLSTEPVYLSTKRWMCQSALSLEDKPVVFERRLVLCMVYSFLIDMSFEHRYRQDLTLYRNAIRLGMIYLTAVDVIHH